MISNHITSNHIISYQIILYQIKSKQAKSYHVMTNPALLCQLYKSPCSEHPTRLVYQ